MNVYMHCAALYCEDCAVNGGDDVPVLDQLEADDRGLDSDSAMIGPYDDSGGEADSPQHCDSCGTFLENELTAVGIAYVADALHARDGDTKTLQAWFDHYEDQILEYLNPGIDRPRI